jgi:hypothetical protein
MTSKGTDDKIHGVGQKKKRKKNFLKIKLSQMKIELSSPFLYLILHINHAQFLD